MAKQLENRAFLFSSYLKPEYMVEEMKNFKKECELKYGKKCQFKQFRNKSGVRIVVEERQAEREEEER